MAYSKTVMTKEARAEVKRIKATSNKLVQRAKKDPAVAYAFLDSIGFYKSNSRSCITGRIVCKDAKSTGSARKSSSGTDRARRKTAKPKATSCKR